MSTDRWMCRLGYVYAMKYHLTIGRNEILMYSAGHMDLENMTQVKSPNGNGHILDDSFSMKYLERQVQETKGRLVVSRGYLKERGVFWVMKVSKQRCQLHNIRGAPNATEPCTLKWLII
jgi:hypothetical protein